MCFAFVVGCNQEIFVVTECQAGVSTGITLTASATSVHLNFRSGNTQVWSVTKFIETSKGEAKGVRNAKGYYESYAKG